MNINIPNETKIELLRAAVLLGGQCPHPKANIIGQFPAHTGGKEVCTLCKMERTQLGHGGPWRQWKARK